MENERHLKDPKEALADGGTYTGMTTGYSMWPLLADHRDNIIVVKNQGRLQKYDIALFQRPNGTYVLHRVTEVHEDYYIIVGDNCLYQDKVTDEMICGVLAGFYRKGKHYVDCRDGKGQKCYARIWVALAPLRPLWQFPQRVYGFIKRRILKK